MASAQRRRDFEDEGDTTKPRNKRTYKKAEKDKPFSKEPGKDRTAPKARRPAADEGDDPLLEEDYDDSEDDDFDPDDIDFEDLDEDEEFEEDWGRLDEEG